MKTKSKTHIREFIFSLLETRTVILNEASQLSAKTQNTVSHGVWSVVDWIAHLVGWDFSDLAAAKVIQVGRLPKFYATIIKIGKPTTPNWWQNTNMMISTNCWRSSATLTVN